MSLLQSPRPACPAKSWLNLSVSLLPDLPLNVSTVLEYLSLKVILVYPFGIILKPFCNSSQLSQGMWDAAGITSLDAKTLRARVVAALLLC